MRQVRVTAVNGRKVQTNGKWLTAIGNRTVSVCELVWTDGRCVYGHQSMSGGDSYVDGKYSPNYMYYGKKGLQDFGHGNPHRYMVNRGNHYAFLPEGGGTMDDDIDSQGNLYTLDYQQVFCNWDTGEFYNNEYGDACVRLNGEIIKEYDILPILLPYIGEMKTRAEALAQPFPSGKDITDYVSYTEMDRFYNLTWSGKVDEQGNFQVLVNAQIRSSHTEHAVHCEGRDGYGFGNIGRCEFNTWFTYDGEQVDYWYKGYTTSWFPYSYSPWAFGNKGWSKTDGEYAPAGSFKLKLNDGYYATVNGLENFVKEWAFKDNCVLSYYSPNGEFLFSAPGNPSRYLMICPMGTGKYLFSYHGKLFLSDNGNISEVVKDCNNYRIRKMPNLRKWKRQTGANDYGHFA